MMSADEMPEKETSRKKTPAEKRTEHLLRIKRSLVGCIMGIVTGVISYLVINPSDIIGFQSYTALGLLIMFAGIVVQRHLFMFLSLEPGKLGKKDWFYQGFMTFAFWFITWTILLTSVTP
jgi:heme/copper-type cytochrome/quinol oxidase subunit 4